MRQHERSCRSLSLCHRVNSNILGICVIIDTMLNFDIDANVICKQGKLGSIGFLVALFSWYCIFMALFFQT